MLTKSDLTNLKKIVREEIETESENTRTELGTEIKMSQFRTLGELDKVKDRLKNLEIMSRKIQKDVKTTINFFDKEDIKTGKRIDRLEEHLNLPPMS